MQHYPTELSGTPLVFEERVVVTAPIDRVYRRWTDFPRFPEFMGQVKEIRPIGADRYHWVAERSGARHEWDAVVTDREINRHVAWHSINGEHHAMTVRLSALDGDQTEIALRVEYDAPVGQDGSSLDHLRQTGQREIQQDLERFQVSCATHWSVPAARPLADGNRRLLLAGAAVATVGILAGATVWFAARRRRSRRSA